jgi:GNAT superfamily N-acetyltransferase
MEYNKTINGQGFRISTENELMQVKQIHRYLSEDSYWAAKIPFDVVDRSIKGSLCFGVFSMEKSEQVGFARMITDKATFAYLCDVYIEETYRGLGLSVWLMEVIMAYPELQRLRRYLLATVGTHGLYEKFGFEITKNPERWMEIKNPDIYKNWEKL